MSDRDDQQPREPVGNDRPYLFIHSYPPPVIGAGYPPQDTGYRPVPPSVCWYLCPGIEALSPFVPGEKLSVQVTVGNWQGGNAPTIANVAVWWSEPTAGPLVPDKDKFIGFDAVSVPPHGGQATTVELTSPHPIPVSAGPHICLLAKVWHTLDLPAGLVAAPVDDRHWAQHNLVAIPAGAPTPVQFLVTNPTERLTNYRILIRPADSALWSNFTAVRPGRPVDIGAIVRLVDTVTGRQQDADDTLEFPIALDPGEQRALQFELHPYEQVESGTFAAYEILQYDSETPIGGIGVTLTGDD